MTIKESKILHLENRISKLGAKPTINDRLVRKAQRKLRKVKEISDEK